MKEMFTSALFPDVTFWSFLAIACAVPFTSLIFLKREQTKIAGGYRKPITALFIAELWLWAIVVGVVGFILILLLGFYVYLVSHSRATGHESVPSIFLIYNFGSESLLIPAGYFLHRFMKHLMY
jgi:hypothetical protein